VRFLGRLAKGFTAFIEILIFASISECPCGCVQKTFHGTTQTHTKPWKLKPTNVCPRKFSWLKSFSRSGQNQKSIQSFAPGLGYSFLSIFFPVYGSCSEPSGDFSELYIGLRAIIFFRAKLYSTQLKVVGQIYCVNCIYFRIYRYICPCVSTYKFLSSLLSRDFWSFVLALKNIYSV